MTRRTPRVGQNAYIDINIRRTVGVFSSGITMHGKLHPVEKTVCTSRNSLQQ